MCRSICPHKKSAPLQCVAFCLNSLLIWLLDHIAMRSIRCSLLLLLQHAVCVCFVEHNHKPLNMSELTEVSFGYGLGWAQGTMLEGPWSPTGSGSFGGISRRIVNTHSCLMALCPGLPGWAGTRKVKPHPSDFYRPDALPAAQPTASKHWRDGALWSIGNIRHEPK